METAQEFWRIVVEVWSQGLQGHGVGKVVFAAGIFLVFLVIRRLFSRFAIANVKLFTRKTRTDFDDKVIAALDKPLQFVPVIMGFFFASEYLTLDPDLSAMSGRLLRSLIAFNIFWAFFNLVTPFSSLLAKMNDVFSESIVEWLVKTVKCVFILLGAAMILEFWGIKIGPILAGLGLFGVAVALGAQDLFKNLIAGVLVLAERRFHKGDWINVDGLVEGTVEAIGLRSTVVRRFDKAPVYVPNARLADNAVTNFSEMTHRRIYWQIALEYRTTVDQLRQICAEIEKAVLSDDAFAHPPDVPTFVRVDSFNDSSIDILLYCFTKTTVWGEWLAIKEGLALRVKTIVEEAGAGFAFPSQSVYVETWPEGAPDPGALSQAAAT